MSTHHPFKHIHDRHSISPTTGSFTGSRVPANPTRIHQQNTAQPYFQDSWAGEYIIITDYGFTVRSEAAAARAHRPPARPPPRPALHPARHAQRLEGVRHEPGRQALRRHPPHLLRHHEGQLISIHFCTILFRKGRPGEIVRQQATSLIQDGVGLKLSGLATIQLAMRAWAANRHLWPQCWKNSEKANIFHHYYRRPQKVSQQGEVETRLLEQVSNIFTLKRLKNTM